MDQLKLLNFHKVWVCFFAVVFLVTFITGIMTCVHYLDVVTYENLINEYLINLLTKKSTYLSFFLMMLLWFSIIVCILIFCTKNIFFVIVNFILLALMSYVWGFDICIIVMTMGLAGVVYGILILGLLGIILFFTIILIMSITCKRFFITKNICDNETKKEYFKVFCCIIIIGIIVIFVMSLLFSSIHIFVIVDWFIRLI